MEPFDMPEIAYILCDGCKSGEKVKASEVGNGSNG